MTSEDEVYGKFNSRRCSTRAIFRMRTARYSTATLHIYRPLGPRGLDRLMTRCVTAHHPWVYCEDGDRLSVFAARADCTRGPASIRLVNAKLAGRCRHTLRTRWHLRIRPRLWRSCADLHNHRLAADSSIDLVIRVSSPPNIRQAMASGGVVSLIRRGASL